MGLLDRIRGEGAPTKSPETVGGGFADRLGSLARVGGQLAGRVAEGVKEATPKRLLRDAIDAHARGNVGAAFFLVRESVEAEPGDVEADTFFWDVAIAFGEPGAAAASAARLVGHHAGQGAAELAAQYFRELVSVAEPALVEPATLVRLLPHLVTALEAAEADAGTEPGPLGTDAPGASHAERIAPDPAAHRAAVLHALRMCVDPANTPLSPGLAMRVAELARPYDGPVALAAAKTALAADDVHEAKRAKLVALVRELDPDAELEGEEALEVDEADLAAVSIELEVSEVGPVPEAPADSGTTASGPGGRASSSPLAAATDDGLVFSAEDVDAIIESPGDAEGADSAVAATLVAPDPTVEPISDAEAERLTSFLEPAEEELEAVTVGDVTDSEEVDEIEVLPELEPIDERDPSRNHPSRVESPAHHALSDDEIDRMRSRIERALGKSRDGDEDEALEDAVAVVPPSAD